jgi:hypothetical protein
MKRVFLFLIILPALCAFAADIDEIVVSGNGEVAEIIISFPQATRFRVSLRGDGSIGWVSVFTARGEVSVSGRRAGRSSLLPVQPEYYDTSDQRDRIRRLGDLRFDYYGGGDKAGRARHIGSLSLDYWEGGARKGLLKQLGALRFDYWEAGSRAGKVRTIGSARFDYYESVAMGGRLRDFSGSIPGVTIRIRD